MELNHLLLFVGGLLVGLVVALLVNLDKYRKYEHTHERADVNIGPITCLSGGGISFGVSADATLCGMPLVQLHSYVSASLTSSTDPPSGSVPHAPSSTVISYPSAPPAGTVTVWAEYRGYISQSRDYQCGSGSGGSSNVVAPFAPMIASGAMDALPRSLRMEPGAADPGAATGPKAELVEVLNQSPEPVLQYVAEASTPAEPLWRALGGPGRTFEATLVLLHRTGGVGAVLTVVTELGGRRVQFTWVTSDWRFNAANRLRCESDEPGVPALLVAPA